MRDPETTGTSVVERDETREAGERERPIDLGRRGEAAARVFLERNGFEILETNWTCLVGEVDIIAYDGYALHFVEVKTRRGTGKGFPWEAVNARKRERYERMAELYLETCEVTDVFVYFDIISIVVKPHGRAFLRFHENAFCRD